MAKRIIWAKEAVADRIQILDYWYKHLGSKDYPSKLDKTFKEVVKLLSHFPFLGRKVEDGREERFFIKDHFYIFYTDEEDSFKVLHIWDNRRDPNDMPI